MASLLDGILRAVGRAATDALASTLKQRARRAGGATRPGRGGSAHSPAPTASPAPRRRRGAAPRTTQAPTGGSAGIRPYDVASAGLPSFDYAPAPDGDADPGEVVWTWVPYEEDASQGKDRPVLVLARSGDRLIVAQMTSKDHDRDAAQEASHGRYWFDVGPGAWDPRGRPSEVRLDRLLAVEPSAIRREGATMGRGTFDAVVAALREHWG
ncbi:PemK-like, MazF-like toxin of type II toxin-antitoxin system [Actinomyces denticolens]|uniref:PemK-like, MazF-like toxin of type II toxin-antitoxin system n=1 Tax=Actinomyces denticolens TaxID=52767 RepID=A0ABY1I3Q7_9ACTO|nr:type II toxin-antitoxin system PemK/MazF family toxin [Actinomyces denticolens]SHI56409.1 PemK-like, MazF-like toxin of type II toxin-antitoxin system [Actinomyces denticolens]